MKTAIEGLEREAPNQQRTRYGSATACLVALLLTAVLLPAAALAESCTSGSEIEPASRAALDRATQGFLQSIASGDVASLRASAIASLASDFGGVEAAVGQNQAAAKSGKMTVSNIFLLQAEGSAPVPRAEFYCGIFNSPDRTTFVFPDLQPGRYAVVVEEAVDAQGQAKASPADPGAGPSRDPLFVTMVLSEQQGAWKLAGLFIKPKALGARDADFFQSKAREFKARGDNLLAWLHYLQAWDLMGPVSFMYTGQRDKLADEMQKSKPNDLPTAEMPLRLASGGKNFAITDIFPEVVDMQGRKDLYLIIKYQASTDVTNTAQTFQANRDAIQAVVAKYPAVRASFDGIVARAVDSTGRDYGTLLSMKDLK
jgi:hypothetical protein